MEFVGWNISLKDNSLKAMLKDSIKVSLVPSKMIGSLNTSPDDSVGWNEYFYLIRMTKGQLPVSWNPFELVKMLFMPSPRMNLSFKLRIHIPQDEVAMAGSSFEKWFTTNKYDFTRIYTMCDPVDYLCTEPIDIVFEMGGN